MGGGARTLRALAAAVDRASGGRLPAALIGNAEAHLAAAAPLDTAGPTDLAFLAQRRLRPQAAASQAGALVLTADDVAAVFPAGRAAGVLVVTAAPHAWFAWALQELHRAPPLPPGIDPLASVHATAQVDPAAHVGPHASVGAGAVLAAGAQVHAGATVGTHARLGADSVLHPGARLLDGCRVGARCIVHANAVIGADGFGFAPFGGAWIKIPQVGAVSIGDDVEIGANTTIDRGALGDTVIEDGVKLDNQIQVAHNVRIGAHTVMAACVGIAGSAVIGRGCQIGGAAMIAGHLTIADGCAIGPGTLVASSIATPGHYTGFFPLLPHRDWERSAALVRNLGGLRERVRRLEALAPKDPA